MSNIIIEDGKLRISQTTIEEISKSKDLDLSCQIDEDGIKIDINKQIAGFDIPVQIFIKNLEIESEMLKLKDFKILLGSMIVPPISFLPFLKKYKFIAMDLENNILNVNLKELVPDYLKFEIDKIFLKKGELEIKFNNIIIILSNLVTQYK